MSLLKDVKIRIRFEEKVIRLVDVGVSNLWGHFKDGVLKACDEVSGMNMAWRSKGDTWWWNEEVKKAVSERKHTRQCVKTVLRRIRGGIKAWRIKQRKQFHKQWERRRKRRRLNYKKIYKNWIFRLAKGLKTNSKAEGGWCMRGTDGKLYFCEKERGIVWKNYTERIMNEVNEWDHNVEEDAVEYPICCVSREEVMQTLKEMKAEELPGPSKVSLELIAASSGVGIQVIAEICQSRRWFRNSS